MPDRVGTRTGTNPAFRTLPTASHRRSRHILMAVYAVLLVLCAAVIGLAHHAERRHQRQEALARLGTATGTLASQLSAGHVALLLDKYREPGLIIKPTQDAWYYVLHDHLRRTAERLGLQRPLRIVAHDSTSGTFVVVVTSEPKPTYRAKLEGDPAWLMANYRTGGRHMVAGELIACDPLAEANGAVTGAVLASMPDRAAVSAAAGSLWRNIAIALLLFGLAGMALFTSVGRWLHRQEEAHDELQRRHIGMTDSIAYVGKIQRSLVPPPQVYNELFEGSFVIDRPKDTVSGDFHWYHRTGPDTCLVAAADCTGHGLPGAMMAAIGCSLLNEVAARHPDRDPACILALLNDRLVSTLHQQGVKRGGGDGMDIALCRIDRSRREILFAGARRPLYWLHEGRVTVINGDRRSVGGAHQQGEARFTVHRLAYSPGDRIYLFSDGYVDQFGGPHGDRFMARRLQDLIDRHQHLPMPAQASVLERAFLEWKGREEQVDDVCVLGLAV